MEVILKQDIPKLGYENDLIVVKNGYARNYLIPNGMAIQATESAKKVLAENLKQRAHKAEKIKTEAETLAAALAGVKLKIGAKSGTSGKIFGSVTSLLISNALAEQHSYEIDRKKIEIDSDKVKELGEYTAKIHLHKEVKCELKFEVVAE